MKRGAKKLPPAEKRGPEFVGGTLPEDVAKQQQMATVIESYSNERDLLSQIIGEFRMTDAFGKFSTTVGISKLAFIKENKLFRALVGREFSDGRKMTGTFEEVCELVGVSPSKAYEDIKNLHVFGEQTMDTLSRVGVGYRELRQYRRLSDDSKSALIEAAESGDKDDLRELAEELLAKQSAAQELEKAKLTKDRDRAQRDADDARQRTAERDAKLRETQRERDEARHVWHGMEPDKQLQMLRVEAERHTRIVINELAPNSENSGLKGALLALAEYAADHDEDVSSYIGGLIGDILMAARRIRDHELIVGAVVKDEPTVRWLGLIPPSEG